MPPVFPDLQKREILSHNTTTAALQVVCAWPVSGQYGPGSRWLYYVLIAACVFARKTDWLRNACLAAVMLFPAVAALHGITLAALHVDGAVDMDIYGAFQLCSLGILAAPVTARLSQTYFNDPGRNMIFLWTGLILAGLLSLTVELFRTQTTACTHDNFNQSIPLSISKFPYETASCGLSCTTDGGPFSPMRKGAANNIYVIPAPDKLTFHTVTLFAAACCVPAILSLVSMWNKVLETNWKTRFSNNTEKHIDEPIAGTNGATIGEMNVINLWIRNLLTAVEAPLFGAAVITILIMGELNFFSSQVRYQTEPIASIGQWAPIVGTGLAVLGSLYMALTKDSRGTEDNARNIEDVPNPSEDDSVSNVSFHTAACPGGKNPDSGERNSNELVPVPSGNSLSQTITHADMGRRKVAKTLAVITNYIGTAGHGQFDDSGFRRGKANDFPEIPGEAHRNRELSRIRERYNPQDRDTDGNITPVSSGRLSRMGSFGSGLQMSPPLPRTPSPGGAQPDAWLARRRSSELQDPNSTSSAGPAESRRRSRRDTLEVPPQVHLSSRSVPTVED